MVLLRTFRILLAAACLIVGMSACGNDSSSDSDATTTTGVVPGDIDEPGDGEDVPADPSTPATNPSGTDY